MDKIGNKGFSLMEVMIAMTMFSVFISAYLISQGGNIASSTLMSEEILLKNLAIEKINETILDPPVFTESLDGKKDTKTFDAPNDGYSYEVYFKKLEVPDFEEVLMGGKSDDIKDNNQQVDAIKKLVFTQLKENIEKIIWQVQVTITNKETGFNFTLSTWIMNPDQPVELKINL